MSASSGFVGYSVGSERKPNLLQVLQRVGPFVGDHHKFLTGHVVNDFGAGYFQRELTLPHKQAESIERREWKFSSPREGASAGRAGNHDADVCVVHGTHLARRSPTQQENSRGEQ